MLTSTSKFEALKEIILHRRTTKVQSMNGNTITPESIHQLLAFADCAPTHARTEPWRFFVYSGKGLEDFCRVHGAMYWDNTDEAKRQETKRELLENQYRHASHLVIVWMKRTVNAKIPWLEEYAATSAAIQNMLLGAEALGLSAIWSTGGMAHKEAMKAYLGLEEDDAVVGFIYLGYSDKEERVADREIPIFRKAEFIN